VRLPQGDDRERDRFAHARAGCRQFDVCESADGSQIFLYEIYDSEAAFKAHLATDHFVRFNELTARGPPTRSSLPTND
jgi:quinol monooxygenase YgiN